MKRLNSLLLGLAVASVFCFVTCAYAAEKTAQAKPQAAKAAQAAVKAAPKAEAARLKAATPDLEKLEQEMQARMEQFRREEIQREIAEGEPGPRRDPNAEPIAIHNIQELQAIGNDRNYPLDGNYILANDIDASETRNWNNGRGFEPIGSYDNWFSGSFDGNGHVISNLYIRRIDAVRVGLFEKAGYATISNVGLINVEINGSYYVGGLVGDNCDYSSITNSYATGSVSGHGCVGGLVGGNYFSSSITNSYATGRVESDGWHVGGLVGGNYFSSITNSYAIGNVSGSNDVGGLVGDNDYSSITNSYATGRVESDGWHVGGLVGGNRYTSITNSYATGNVSGSNDVGGLVGDNQYTSITNSYATGRVESDGWHVGGLVGYSDGPDEYYRNNYFDRETTGQEYGVQRGDRPNIPGVQGKTTAEMMRQATFENWDFDGVWYIEEGRSYPRHRWEEPPVVQQTIDLHRGGNLISFYAIPGNIRMRDIVQPLIEANLLDWVVDEAGNHIVYVPAFDWVDTGIGDLSVNKGYYVQVRQDTTLTIEGALVRLPHRIPLRQGWNWISYPVRDPQPAMNVFRQLVDAGIQFRVTDFQGNFIVYSNGDLFSNLDNLQPGQGYRILVDRDADLVINAP